MIAIVYRGLEQQNSFRVYLGSLKLIQISLLNTPTVGYRHNRETTLFCVRHN